MKRLLTLDSQNYTDEMPVFEKHTVRAVIIRDGLIAMQQSGTGEYKIPGGGVENGESREETLIREVREETGLLVMPETIKEIGEILELREDLFTPGIKYICHSYFYLCDAREETVETEMTESEIMKGFHPVWASFEEIVRTNERVGQAVCSERDTSFIRLLKEGLVDL